MSIEDCIAGPRLLRAWIERRALSRAEAAGELGLHYVHLCQFLAESKTPGLVTAIRIERATGIPVEAWVATSVGGYAHGLTEVPAKP